MSDVLCDQRMGVQTDRGVVKVVKGGMQGREDEGCKPVGEDVVGGQAGPAGKIM